MPRSHESTIYLSVEGAHHVNPTKSGISTAPYSAWRRAVLDVAPHGLRPIGPVRSESLCRPALADARPVPRRPHRCGDRRPGPALRVLLRRRQRRRVEDNQRRAVLATGVRQPTRRLHRCPCRRAVQS